VPAGAARRASGPTVRRLCARLRDLPERDGRTADAARRAHVERRRDDRRRPAAGDLAQPGAPAARRPVPRDVLFPDVRAPPLKGRMIQLAQQFRALLYPFLEVASGTLGALLLVLVLNRLAIAWRVGRHARLSAKFRALVERPL